MQNLTPLILLLPLAGFLALGLFGHALPRPAVALLACGTVLGAFVLAVVNLVTLLSVPVAQRTSDVVLWTWLTSGALRVNVGLLLDPLSAVLLLVVTGVGFLIHVYATGYMAEDEGHWRFFAYMNLFIFAMALLVAADNFVLLLVGWGGVGLVSFLLIGFWYTRPAAVAAARKAFVVNVIGDVGLMLAIFLLVARVGSVEYARVLHGPLPDGGTLTAIALLLFVACVAKSAQLPLHVWLPDAMEGPTPVSALIHAATMVTAGVYLVARAAPLFAAAPGALVVVGVVAGASTLFAASLATAQTDIKRILAYSTMSQLGYMFLGEAAGNFSGGIFHLTTHAYYKALLFLAAGAVIHALAGEQDIRKMGGLARRLPVTFGTFLMGGLALAAIFPFAGFWSKDSILAALLERASVTGQPLWYLLYGVALLTAVLTGFYTTRLLCVVFLGSYRGGTVAAAHGAAGQRGGRSAPRDPLARVHEVGLRMRLPMLALAALSLLGGFYGTPWTNGIGTFLEPVLGRGTELAVGSGPFWLSLTAGLVAALVGVGLGWARYGRGAVPAGERVGPFVRLLRRRYFVDELYAAVLVRPVVALGAALRGGLEERTLEGGAQGLGAAVRSLSGGLRRTQSGYLRAYALGIFFGATLLTVYLVAWR